MEKQKKTTIKKDKLVPYRRYGLFQKDEKKYMYLLDQNIVGKMHYKLYYDIVEWFWNNADEVLDYYEDIKVKLKINDMIKIMLSVKRDKDIPYYNISFFLTNGEVEFLDHDGFMEIQIIPKRVELLRDWLESKGWLRDVIVCPEECPAFTRYSKEKKEDQTVILGSLIEWEGYDQITKNRIIQKYKEAGYTFFEKAAKMKFKENAKPSGTIYAGDFHQMDPKKDYH